MILQAEGMSSAPHVVHVVASLAPGGLEKLVVQWANERNGCMPGSTSICCLDEPGELAAEANGDVISCVTASRGRFPFDIGAAKRLRALLASRRTPIVHSHNTAAQQYAGLATMLSSVRHVHTEHGSNVYFHGVGNRARNLFLRVTTDRTVAVSEDTADRLSATHGMARKRIRVVRNGVAPHPVQTSEQVESLRAEMRLAGGALVLGSVGRLAHVKGYDRLIAAFAAMLQVSGSDSAPVLLLVGDGPGKDDLGRQAKALGVESAVRFAGYRRDARCFYDVMDLFLLPSRSEGLSIALLEAMAAGVPVLVTDVGENRRVLEDGACGEMLSDDEGEWGRIISNQLSVVSSQSRESAERVRRAKERVEEHYSMEATRAAYERLYEELAS